MRLIFKAIKSTLYSLLFIAVILIVLATLLLTTSTGLNLGVKVANYFAPGQLVVNKIHGRAINHIAFDHLLYTDKAISIELNQVDLQWHLSNLLHHKLVIDKLTVDKATVHLLPQPDAINNNPFEFPHLPVSILINDATINRLDFSQDKLIIPTVNAIHISAEISNTEWKLQQFDFNVLNQNLKLQTTLQPVFPYQANALLLVAPAANSIAPFQGQITIHGNLLNYQWQGDLQSPAHLKLNGSLINGVQLNTKMDWSQLHWLFSQTQTIDSEKGQVTIIGTLPDLTINLNTRLSAPFQSSWQINAKTREQAADIDATMSTPQGKTVIKIAFDNAKAPKLLGTIKIDSNDAFIQPVDHFKSTIELSGNSLATLSIFSQITANYLQNKFDATLHYQNEQINTQLNLGLNHIEITGSPTGKLQLAARLPAPYLLHPALTGLKTTITADGFFDNKQQGALAISINKGVFKIPHQPDLAFAGGELQTKLSHKILQSTGNFTIDNYKKLTLALTLPDFNINAPTSPKQRMQGNLTLDVNSLDFIKNFSDLIYKANGQLHIKLNAKGTLKKPELKGYIDLENGAIAIPKLGLNLNPIQFSLHSQDKIWDTKGIITSNGKQIQVQGNGDFFPVLKGNLSILGEHVPVFNTPEYFISVTPKLTLEFSPDILKIRGTVLIPKALIKPQTFNNSISMSDDVVFVGEKPASNPLHMDTDIHIEMGDDVMLAVKGLQGLLFGGIKLRQLPEGPLNATGELNVREGKYKAYGQNLTIEKGQLLFTGGLVTNPGIEVRAIRQFNNATTNFAGSEQLFDFNTANLQTIDFGNKTTVGIQVTGRLKKPKVQLFSVPATLSQADILSMLILGKPASQANKSGGQLLLTAVSALNLDSGTGGTQLLSQLKDKLGIDFNLENNSQYNQKTNQSTDNTAVVVGKSLSKRIYLSYNIGLSPTDSNVFTLKYLLNKFFSIQVSASMTGSGIDVLYTHQKD